MEFNLELAQTRAVNELKKTPYSILHGDIGTGKTLICLTLQNELQRNRTVVIVPAYLLYNWEAEIRKFYPNKKYKLISQGKDIKLTEGVEIYIVSYGLVKLCDVLFSWAHLVIADESHYLKSIKAARTNIIHKLVYENSVERLVLATGTPITNRVWEFYSLLALCEYDPKKLDSAFLKKFPNYVKFADHFSNRTEFKIRQGKYSRTVVQWNGIKNVDELKVWLGRVRVRVRLEEVMGGSLPDIVEKDVSFDNVDNPELEEAFNRFIEEGGESVKSDIKARAALETVPLTVSYVKDLLSSGVEKVLIYTDHVEAAKALAKAFEISCITGETDMVWRRRLGESFQNETTPILIATIGAFSTGVTLTSCNHTVFNDENWVSGVMEQARGRTRRKGQLKVCFYHYIHKFVQSLKIRKALNDKSKVIAITDSRSEKWDCL